MSRIATWLGMLAFLVGSCLFTVIYFLVYLIFPEQVRRFDQELELLWDCGD